MGPVLRNAALLSSVGAGFAVARIAHLGNLTHYPGYAYVVTAILALGLYASTSSIEIKEFRSQLSVIVLALTFGVLAKAAIIAGVMYLVFHTPGAMLFGVAVAQIDPLAVIALNKRSAMSRQAKALLTAWASFDDPITVLLTVYVATFVVPHGEVLAGVDSLGFNLVASVALAVVVIGVWWLAAHRTRPHRRPAVARAARVVGGAGVAVLSVAESLLLSLAVIGLFVRPGSRRLLDAATQYALYAGCFALGLVLVGPYHVAQGVVLGCTAYAAHAVVASVLTIRQRGDRVRLMLGQQNGLTAILLALLLEPAFPGATSTIAIAVLVIGGLYGVCNWAWDRYAPPVPSTAVGQQRLASGLADAGT